MSWRVGDFSLTRLVELDMVGRGRFFGLSDASAENLAGIGWLAPQFVDEEGKLRVAAQLYVVDTPLARIVVDTGIGNDKIGRPVASWNQRDTPLLGLMADRGIPASSIDMVFCTHIHVDHVGWNTRLVEGAWQASFPNARYLFGRREFDHARASTDPLARLIFEDSVAPLVRSGKVDLVDPGDSLTEGVSTVLTPGHSIGHMSLRLQSGGTGALLTGDVAHHPCQMARPDWGTTADFDPLLAARTRRQVFAEAMANHDLIAGAHFSPGRILPGQDDDAFAFALSDEAPAAGPSA